MLTINTWVFVILFLAFGFVSLLFGASVIMLHDKIKKEDEEDEDMEIIPSVIVKNKDGQLMREDKYGVAVYDPESGEWKSLN